MSEMLTSPKTTDKVQGLAIQTTRREFYGKNFQIRIRVLNRGQVEKLTSLTKRI